MAQKTGSGQLSWNKRIFLRNTTASAIYPWGLFSISPPLLNPYCAGDKYLFNPTIIHWVLPRQVPKKTVKRWLSYKSHVAYIQQQDQQEGSVGRGTMCRPDCVWTPESTRLQERACSQILSSDLHVCKGACTQITSRLSVISRITSGTYWDSVSKHKMTQSGIKKNVGKSLQRCPFFSHLFWNSLYFKVLPPVRRYSAHPCYPGRKIEDIP